MATVEELWNMAHDIYARARASLDPLAKRRLLRVADDYLKQANELRRTGVVIQAAFPDSRPPAVSDPVEPRPRKAAGS